MKGNNSLRVMQILWRLSRLFVRVRAWRACGVCVQMWACVRRSRRATLEETTLNLNAGERDKDASTGLSS